MKMHVAAAVFLMGFAGARAHAQYLSSGSPGHMIDSVSLANLTSHIRALQSAGGHWSRVTFTPGNDSASAYIRRMFDAVPHLTSVVNDTFYIPSANPPYNTKPLVNVVATLEGKTDPSKIYIVGAHLDCSASRMGSTIWNQQWRTIRAPGADDNATGVAAILEMARVMSDPAFGFTNDFTIRFIAFGAEESGPAYPGAGSHPGSSHYAQAARARGDSIRGMISMDMLGYNDNYYFQSIVSDAASEWLGRTIIAANDSNSIGLVLDHGPLPYATFSDHYSFWLENYTAICLIEYAPPWSNGTYYTANPYYHKSSDTLETVNMELVRRVTQTTMAALVSLTGTVTAVGQAGQVAEVPSSFGLEQNYPNPFNPVTTITYRIPDVGTPLDVSVRVYDVLGREVATLVDERKAAGVHSVQFDGSALASSVYLYRIQARHPHGAKVGSFVQAKKMLLVR